MLRNFFKISINLWAKRSTILFFVYLDFILYVLFNFLLKFIEIRSNRNNNTHNASFKEKNSKKFCTRIEFYGTTFENITFIIYYYLFWYNFHKNYTVNFYLKRIAMKLYQTGLNFYNYAFPQTSVHNLYATLYFHVYFGFKFFWKINRLWLIPLSLVFNIINFGLITQSLSFNKIIFLWFSLFMIFYWFISGLVFFIKKYKYGKYTSVIQRFWRRSYILFWLLESCLMLVFIFLTFTASQESFYMYDEIQIYKTHLFSWRFFFLKNLPLILLILLNFFFLLTLKWNNFSKQTNWLIFYTFLLTYVVWIEFYQFFHCINFYCNLNWNYDVDEKLWLLELELQKTRVVNHYVMWLLVLKFWHLLFVYVFWIFFILRSLEKNSITFSLFSVNQQNILILFIMNWFVMIPWFKIYFRKFLDISYYWFYMNKQSLLIRIFFYDLKLFFNEISTDFFKQRFITFNHFSFFYWIESTSRLILNQTKKHFIRNQILNNLVQKFN